LHYPLQRDGTPWTTSLSAETHFGYRDGTVGERKNQRAINEDHVASFNFVQIYPARLSLSLLAEI